MKKLFTTKFSMTGGDSINNDGSRGISIEGKKKGKNHEDVNNDTDIGGNKFIF